MTTITQHGNPVHTIGELPEVGKPAPEFSLVGNDLSEVTPALYAGRRLVLNIFPSVDTGTCAISVRTFNEKAAALDNATVLCISNDLPFAQARFCGAEGISNVVMGSGFRSSFGKDYGVTMVDGKLEGLLSRSVVVIDTDGTVIYTEQVPEISQEPDYDSALAALA